MGFVDAAEEEPAPSQGADVKTKVRSYFLRAEPWLAPAGFGISVGIAFIMYLVVTPSNATIQIVRLSAALLGATISALVFLMINTIATKERIKEFETTVRSDQAAISQEVPRQVEAVLLSSIGFQAASLFPHLRQPVADILQSYQNAAKTGASPQLLNYASESLTRLAASMSQLSDKRLKLDFTDSFFMDTWKARTKDAHDGTIAVCTSIVDATWWEDNQDWLDYTCRELMDKRNFVWARIFIFRNQEHADSLQQEMNRQAQRGIRVFSVMEHNVPGISKADLMLIGCDLNGLSRGDPRFMEVRGGQVLGSNALEPGEAGAHIVTGLQISENRADISNAAKTLNAFLEQSRPIDPVWAKRFFDERYPIIAAFKENEASTETASIIRIIRDHFGVESETWILDLACAHGRIGIELVRRSGATFHIVGVDTCEALIEKANETAKEYGVSDLAKFQVGDMNDLANQRRERSYDAVISIFNSFGYFDDDERNLKTLQEMRRCLRKDGLLILDVDDKKFFRDFREGKKEPAGGDRDAKFNWGSRDFHVECWHSYDAAAHRRRSRFFVQEADSPVREELPLVSVRLFDEGELRAMLVKSGFEVVSVLSSLDGAPYVAGETEHMIFVATARGTASQ